MTLLFARDRLTYALESSDEESGGRGATAIMSAMPGDRKSNSTISTTSMETKHGQALRPIPMSPAGAIELSEKKMMREKTEEEGEEKVEDDESQISVPALAGAVAASFAAAAKTQDAGDSSATFPSEDVTEAEVSSIPHGGSRPHLLRLRERSRLSSVGRLGAVAPGSACSRVTRSFDSPPGPVPVQHASIAAKTRRDGRQDAGGNAAGHERRGSGCGTREARSLRSRPE